MSNKITICIPTYQTNNGYLKTAIDSVLAQTNEGWTLILVDGSSSENIELFKLVQELNHPAISFVRNSKNHTMAGNWNYAIELANTELVTLLHDDDLLAPDYVEKMLQFAQQFPTSSAYYCDVKLIDENGVGTWTVADKVKSFIRPNKHINHIAGDEGLASLLKGCYVFCPTVCYRKSKLPQPLFKSHWKMVTDFQCYFDLLVKGETMSGLSEKLYLYRRHQNNQTAKLTANMERFEEEVALYEFIKTQLKNHWPKSVYVASKKRIVRLHLLFLMLKGTFHGNLASAKRCILFYKKHFM